MSTEPHVLHAADARPLPDDYDEPAWRFAWDEMARLGWNPGTVLSHDFLCRCFGLPPWSVTGESVRLSRTFSLKHLHPLKEHLLEQHEILLAAAYASDGGPAGWRIVSADEQVHEAPRKHARTLDKAFEKLDAELKHVRVDELSDVGRRRHEKGVVYQDKIAALMGQARMLLPKAVEEVPAPAAEKPDTSARRSLPLVECEPYKARLTQDACVSRWESARSQGKKTDFDECLGCPVGAERAGKDAA